MVLLIHEAVRLHHALLTVNHIVIAAGLALQVAVNAASDSAVFKGNHFDARAACDRNILIFLRQGSFKAYDLNGTESGHGEPSVRYCACSRRWDAYGFSSDRDRRM